MHDKGMVRKAADAVVRSGSRVACAELDAPTFESVTSLNPKQQRALELINKIDR